MRVLFFLLLVLVEIHPQKIDSILYALCSMPTQPCKSFVCVSFLVVVEGGGWVVDDKKENTHQAQEYSLLDDNEETNVHQNECKSRSICCENTTWIVIIRHL